MILRGVESCLVSKVCVFFSMLRFVCRRWLLYTYIGRRAQSSGRCDVPCDFVLALLQLCCTSAL